MTDETGLCIGLCQRSPLYTNTSIPLSASLQFTGLRLVRIVVWGGFGAMVVMTARRIVGPALPAVRIRSRFRGFIVRVVGRPVRGCRNASRPGVGIAGRFSKWCCCGCLVVVRCIRRLFKAVWIATRCAAGGCGCGSAVRRSGFGCGHGFRIWAGRWIFQDFGAAVWQRCP